MEVDSVHEVYKAYWWASPITKQDVHIPQRPLASDVEGAKLFVNKTPFINSVCRCFVGFSLAHNVLALGAVADFGARLVPIHRENCQYTTKVDAR